MGEIVNQEQHDKDVELVRAVVAEHPIIVHHLSHHLRNPLQSVMTSVEIAQRNLDAGQYEAIRNDLARIMKATDHIVSDLCEIEL